jgi:protein-S-isoprenylcysteine O-methyltransferase Ste14
VTSPSGLFWSLLVLELALAAVTFVALRFITAPYGRHGRGGWGPTVPARAAWLVMESPAAVLFAGVYATGAHRTGLVPLVLLAMWEAHYLYRAFWYPFLARAGARMPVLVVLLAIAFNALNAWLNARWISHYGRYAPSWLADPRFLVGLALFGCGLAVHVTADRTLRRLRAPGETGYRIPYGGGYRWVSSPNYLGEIVEWSGWALAAWSPAGLAFALYSAANLVPRAADHHAWYARRFPDYPPRRRALIPYLW